MTLAFFIKTEILTFDFNFNCLFAVVSVGKTVVRVDVAVCVGSIGVGEGGVMVGSIAVVTSPNSRVVHPGIGLRVSLGIGLSNGFSLSLHKWHILGISRAFAVVSIGKTVVRIDVAVCVGSVGVGEGGVMVGSIAVVTSPDSRVVHPGIGLRVSLSAGLSNGLSLSLLHSDGRFLLNSSGGGGGHNSGGYKTAMGAGDKSSSIVGASSSIGHHGRMGDGQSVGKGVVGIGIGEDSGSGVGEGGVSLGLSVGKGS